jgi:hypothetical protein
VRRVVGQIDNHARFQPVCVEADNGFIGQRICFDPASGTKQSEAGARNSIAVPVSTRIHMSPGPQARSAPCSRRFNAVRVKSRAI